MKRVLGVMPAALVAQVAGRGLTSFPDIPKAEPFTETVFGVSVDDPLSVV
ncbi:hypothetical protein [uncultured Sphingomonas sp.]